MKIMMLVSSYPPIIESAARLYSELAESLYNMGHNVTVVTEYPADDRPIDTSHKYYGNNAKYLLLNGVNVLRISPLFILYKINFVKALRFVMSCILFSLRGIFSKSQDVILVYSPPLFMGISGYLISKIKRAALVFNLQDIHPKVLFNSGAIKNTFLRFIFQKMENFCYMVSDSFIVYSEGNKQYLLDKGIDKEVFIIPNWVDTTILDSSEEEVNVGDDTIYDNKFIISYAGIIQEAQGLEIIVDAAIKLKKFNNILFIIAGEGAAKKDLQCLVDKRKITNVLFYPVMPRKQYIKFLNNSDICLISLSKDIPLETVPGKLADLMACGKPVLAVVNHKGDAAGIIRQSGCGICVEPGDAESFTDAVLKMYRYKEMLEKMGESGRLFAEKNFSRDVCTKLFEKVLTSEMKYKHDN